MEQAAADSGPATSLPTELEQLLDDMELDAAESLRQELRRIDLDDDVLDAPFEIAVRTLDRLLVDERFTLQRLAPHRWAARTWAGDVGYGVTAAAAVLQLAGAAVRSQLARPRHERWR